MTLRSRNVRLARRPTGVPSTDDFVVTEDAVSPPAAGEVLVQVAYASVDPYLRLRMRVDSGLPSPIAVGDVIPGQGVGRVLHSSGSRFTPGDWVVGKLGWSEIGRASGSTLRAFDPSLGPVSESLGALGMPGFTAWLAFRLALQHRLPEVAFVSAAAGAVGSIAGQLLKRAGSTVVGSAGSCQKIEWLASIGFDAAFNYKAEDFEGALGRLAPRGLDAAVELVGGDQLSVVLGAMRDHGTVVIAGASSAWTADAWGESPVRNTEAILLRALTVQGFRFEDHLDLMPDFLEDMAGGLARGDIRATTHVYEGLRCLPEAFEAALAGVHCGKVLVKVGDE